MKKEIKVISFSMKERNNYRQFCLRHITTTMMQNMRCRLWTKSFERRVEWFIEKVKERKYQRFIIDEGHKK